MTNQLGRIVWLFSLLATGGLADGLVLNAPAVVVVPGDTKLYLDYQRKVADQVVRQNEAVTIASRVNKVTQVRTANRTETVKKSIAASLKAGTGAKISFSVDADASYSSEARLSDQETYDDAVSYTSNSSDATKHLSTQDITLAENSGFVTVGFQFLNRGNVPVRISNIRVSIKAGSQYVAGPQYLLQGVNEYPLSTKTPISGPHDEEPIFPNGSSPVLGMRFKGSTNLVYEWMLGGLRPEILVNYDILVGEVATPVDQAKVRADALANGIGVRVVDNIGNDRQYYIKWVDGMTTEEALRAISPTGLEFDQDQRYLRRFFGVLSELKSDDFKELKDAYTIEELRQGSWVLANSAMESLSRDSMLSKGSELAVVYTTVMEFMDASRIRDNKIDLPRVWCDGCDNPPMFKEEYFKTDRNIVLRVPPRTPQDRFDTGFSYDPWELQKGDVLRLELRPMKYQIAGSNRAVTSNPTDDATWAQVKGCLYETSLMPSIIGRTASDDHQRVPVDGVIPEKPAPTTPAPQRLGDYGIQIRLGSGGWKALEEVVPEVYPYYERLTDGTLRITIPAIDKLFAGQHASVSFRSRYRAHKQVFGFFPIFATNPPPYPPCAFNEPLLYSVARAANLVLGSTSRGELKDARAHDALWVEEAWYVETVSGYVDHLPVKIK